MKEIFLTIVLPCYDEMANLQKGVLDKVVLFLERKGKPYEIIVVDDGSHDGSIEFLKKFSKVNPQVRVLTNQHLGKAGAVTAGVLEAKGSYVLFTDMDQATPIEEINKLLPFFTKGYDVVIGSRSSHREGAPLNRLIVSLGMIFLRKAIVGMPTITDTQCGFKMFRRDVAYTLFSRLEKFHHGYSSIKGSNVTAGFDVELLFLSEKLGYKIKEVPVTWLYVESRRVNPVHDAIKGLLSLVSIRINAKNY